MNTSTCTFLPQQNSFNVSLHNACVYQYERCNDNMYIDFITLEK